MTTKTASPIKRNTLADEVARRLQEQISLGNYRPGEKLPPEPALMRDFGVGRSTIREAVRILANAGMLRVQQGLGTFVEESTDIGEPLSQRLRRARFKELEEVRLMLEMRIAEKAAEHRSAEDIEKMEHHLKKRKEFAAANRVEECMQADIDFHNAIAEASGNSILTDLYKTVARHLKQYFAEMFDNTGTFTRSQQLHKNLMKSIVVKDAQKALYWARRITLHMEEEWAEFNKKEQ